MPAPIHKLSTTARSELRRPGRATGRTTSGVQPALGGASRSLLAEGTLGSRPLALLLRDSLDRRIHGRLTLVDERGQRHELVLLIGVPVALKSDTNIEPLATSLQRVGLITPQQRAQLTRRHRCDADIARELVEQGIVTLEALEGVRRHRLMLRIERLMSLSAQTRFTLRCDGRHDAIEPRPCNVLALLMRGFRRLAGTPRGREVLESLRGRELSLRQDADTRFLGLTRVEREVVDGLGAAAATLDELEELGIGPKPVVRAAVYALAELRFLALGLDDPPVTLPSRERLGDVCRVYEPNLRVDDPSSRPPRGPMPIAEPTADELLRRAEVAFRHRELDKAEDLLMRVLSTDRHHLDARALLAWVGAQRIPAPKLALGQTSMVYAGPLEILDEVVREDPTLERARYWRGQLLERAGFRSEAYADFKAVVTLNPRNVGAEREVRRFEMRQRPRDEPNWRRWLSSRPK